MSVWEYNTICCGAYAKADYTNASLYVIDSKTPPAREAARTPVDYVQTMGADGWKLICQTPQITPASSFLPSEILFSFRRLARA